ncbi:hypothetical protein WJX84_000266 [Apatococcus fuscideae]|uniref:Uncharacterized protein n=1 Tax=Apatococcus fuscideae TaxID=2026836 RepID=A0AAW1SZM2_9CHLO
MCRRARCARQHRRAQLSPAAYEALEPTIYEQLTPFLGGITQSQVDKAISWFTDPGPPPKYADLKYNMTAATTLRADDPLYPYSNPYILKVVVKDGVFYLPGGRIAPIREGFAFTSQWSSGFLLLDLLNASDKYGPFPDMEFFVTSGDFQRLYHLSDDGTTFPLFSATGSKHFYDLVLPESPTTQYIRETPVSYKWSDRTDKVVGRFNLMCHRGGPSRPGREEGQQFGHKYLTKEASECYTKKFLEVLSSLFTYKPRPLGPLAISLRDAIELVEADRIWMEQHPEPVQDEDPDES